MLNSLKGSRVIIKSKNGAHKIIKPNGKYFKIGSDIFCDLRIKSLRVKGVHCKIYVTSAEQIKIKNYDQQNPIKLNNKILYKSKLLHNRDIFEINNKHFQWEYNKKSNHKLKKRWSELVRSKNDKKSLSDNTDDDETTDKVAVINNTEEKKISVNTILKKRKSKFVCHSPLKKTSTFFKKRMTIHNFHNSSSSDSEEMMMEEDINDVLSSKDSVVKTPNKIQTFKQTVNEQEKMILPLESSTPFHSSVRKIQKENEIPIEKSYCERANDTSLKTPKRDNVENQRSKTPKSVYHTPKSAYTTATESDALETSTIIDLITPDTTDNITCNIKDENVDSITPTTSIKSLKKSMVSTKSSTNVTFASNLDSVDDVTIVSPQTSKKSEQINLSNVVEESCSPGNNLKEKRIKRTPQKFNDFEVTKKATPKSKKTDSLRVTLLNKNTPKRKILSNINELETTKNLSQITESSNNISEIFIADDDESEHVEKTPKTILTLDKSSKMNCSNIKTPKINTLKNYTETPDIFQTPISKIINKLNDNVVNENLNTTTIKHNPANKFNETINDDEISHLDNIHNIDEKNIVETTTINQLEKSQKVINDEVKPSNKEYQTIDEVFDNLIGKPIIKHTYSRTSKSLSPQQLKEKKIDGNDDSKTKTTEQVQVWINSLTNVTFDDTNKIIPNNNKQILSARYSNVTPHKPDEYNKINVDNNKKTADESIILQDVTAEADQTINTSESIPTVEKKTELNSKLNYLNQSEDKSFTFDISINLTSFNTTTNTISDDHDPLQMTKEKINDLEQSEEDILLEEVLEMEDENINNLESSNVKVQSTTTPTYKNIVGNITNVLLTTTTDTNPKDISFVDLNKFNSTLQSSVFMDPLDVGENSTSTTIFQENLSIIDENTNCTTSIKDNADIKEKTIQFEDKITDNVDDHQQDNKQLEKTTNEELNESIDCIFEESLMVEDADVSSDDEEIMATCMTTIKNDIVVKDRLTLGNSTNILNSPKISEKSLPIINDQEMKVTSDLEEIYSDHEILEESINNEQQSENIELEQSTFIESSSNEESNFESNNDTSIFEEEEILEEDKKVEDNSVILTKNKSIFNDRNLNPESSIIDSCHESLKNNDIFENSKSDELLGLEERNIEEEIVNQNDNNQSKNQSTCKDPENDLIKNNSIANKIVKVELEDELFEEGVLTEESISETLDELTEEEQSQNELTEEEEQSQNELTEENDQSQNELTKEKEQLNEESIDETLDELKEEEQSQNELTEKEEHSQNELTKEKEQSKIKLREKSILNSKSFKAKLSLGNKTSVSINSETNSDKKLSVLLNDVFAKQGDDVFIDDEVIDIPEVNMSTDEENKLLETDKSDESNESSQEEESGKKSGLLLDKLSTEKSILNRKSFKRGKLSLLGNNKSNISINDKTNVNISNVEKYDVEKELEKMFSNEEGVSEVEPNHKQLKDTFVSDFVHKETEQLLEASLLEEEEVEKQSSNELKEKLILNRKSLSGGSFKNNSSIINKTNSEENKLIGIEEENRKLEEMLENDLLEVETENKNLDKSNEELPLKEDSASELANDEADLVLLEESLEEQNPSPIKLIEKSLLNTRKSFRGNLSLGNNKNVSLSKTNADKSIKQKEDTIHEICSDKDIMLEENKPLEEESVNKQSKNKSYKDFNEDDTFSESTNKNKSVCVLNMDVVEECKLSSSNKSLLPEKSLIEQEELTLDKNSTNISLISEQILENSNSESVNNVGSDEEIPQQLIVAVMDSSEKSAEQLEMFFQTFHKKNPSKKENQSIFDETDDEDEQQQSPTKNSELSPIKSNNTSQKNLSAENLIKTGINLQTDSSSGVDLVKNNFLKEEEKEDEDVTDSKEEVRVLQIDQTLKLKSPEKIPSTTTNNTTDDVVLKVEENDVENSQLNFDTHYNKTNDINVISSEYIPTCTEFDTEIDFESELDQIGSNKIVAIQKLKQKRQLNNESIIDQSLFDKSIKSNKKQKLIHSTPITNDLKLKRREIKKTSASASSSSTITPKIIKSAKKNYNHNEKELENELIIHHDEDVCGENSENFQLKKLNVLLSDTNTISTTTTKTIIPTSPLKRSRREVKIPTKLSSGFIINSPTIKNKIGKLQLMKNNSTNSLNQIKDKEDQRLKETKSSETIELKTTPVKEKKSVGRKSIIIQSTREDEITLEKPTVLKITNKEENSDDANDDDEVFVDDVVIPVPVKRGRKKIIIDVQEDELTDSKMTVAKQSKSRRKIDKMESKREEEEEETGEENLDRKEIITNTVEPIKKGRKPVEKKVEKVIIEDNIEDKQQSTPLMIVKPTRGRKPNNKNQASINIENDETKQSTPVIDIKSTRRGGKAKLIDRNVVDDNLKIEEIETEVLSKVSKIGNGALVDSSEDNESQETKVIFPVPVKQTKRGRRKAEEEQNEIEIEAFKDHQPTQSTSIKQIRNGKRKVDEEAEEQIEIEEPNISVPVKRVRKGKQKIDEVHNEAEIQKSSTTPIKQTTRKGGRPKASKSSVDENVKEESTVVEHKEAEMETAKNIPVKQTTTRRVGRAKIIKSNDNENVEKSNVEEHKEAEIETAKETPAKRAARPKATKSSADESVKEESTVVDHKEAEMETAKIIPVKQTTTRRVGRAKIIKSNDNENVEKSNVEEHKEAEIETAKETPAKRAARPKATKSSVDESVKEESTVVDHKEAEVETAKIIPVKQTTTRRVGRAKIIKSNDNENVEKSNVEEHKEAEIETAKETPAKRAARPKATKSSVDESVKEESTVVDHKEAEMETAKIIPVKQTTTRRVGRAKIIKSNDNENVEKLNVEEHKEAQIETAIKTPARRAARPKTTKSNVDESVKEESSVVEHKEAKIEIVKNTPINQTTTKRVGRAKIIKSNDNEEPTVEEHKEVEIETAKKTPIRRAGRGKQIKSNVDERVEEHKEAEISKNIPIKQATRRAGRAKATKSSVDESVKEESAVVEHKEAEIETVKNTPIKQTTTKRVGRAKITKSTNVEELKNSEEELTQNVSVPQKQTKSRRRNAEVKQNEIEVEASLKEEVEVAEILVSKGKTKLIEKDQQPTKSTPIKPTRKGKRKVVDEEESNETADKQSKKVKLEIDNEPNTSIDEEEPNENTQTYDNGKTVDSSKKLGKRGGKTKQTNEQIVDHKEILKHNHHLTIQQDNNSVAEPSPATKKRGRPAKKLIEDNNESHNLDVEIIDIVLPPKKRGRQRQPSQKEIADDVAENKEKKFAGVSIYDIASTSILTEPTVIESIIVKEKATRKRGVKNITVDNNESTNTAVDESTTSKVTKSTLSQQQTTKRQRKLKSDNEIKNIVTEEDKKKEEVLSPVIIRSARGRAIRSKKV